MGRPPTRGAPVGSPHPCLFFVVIFRVGRPWVARLCAERPSGRPAHLSVRLFLFSCSFARGPPAYVQSARRVALPVLRSSCAHGSPAYVRRARRVAYIVLHFSVRRSLFAMRPWVACLRAARPSGRSPSSSLFRSSCAHGSPTYVRHARRVALPTYRSPRAQGSLAYVQRARRVAQLYNVQPAHRFLARVTRPSHLRLCQTSCTRCPTPQGVIEGVRER